MVCHQWLVSGFEVELRSIAEREGGSFRCASGSVGLGLRMRASQIYFYSAHIKSLHKLVANRI